MWIKVDQDLRQHFKVKQMARILDTSVAAVCGHMQFLWSWALDYAPNGDISRFDAWDIADAAGWDGDPEQFYDALFAVGGKDRPGFLEHGDDGAVMIHDWMEHTGKIFESNQKDRDRKKETRSAKKEGKMNPPDEVGSDSNTPEPSADIHGMSPEVRERPTDILGHPTDIHRTSPDVRPLDIDLDLERDREGSKTDVNARARATDAPTPPENSVDAESVAAIWTEILVPHGFRKCEKVGDWLRDAVRERVQEDLARASPEWWRETFGRAAQSKWLLRAKFFTLSWAVKSGEHLEKIRGGHYEDWRFSGKGKAEIAEDAPRDINELLGELGMPLVASSAVPIEMAELQEVVEGGA